eukprot:6193964-Pleurochrysis_carterae.AAC.1
MLMLMLMLLLLLLSAGRHAATYELECIGMRQKIDAQRNTINNIEAEIVNLDKKTVRALRERDYVQQVAAAQQEGASAAAEEARGAYETNLKQQQATANVKYKALLKQMQEERDASSHKVTGLVGGEHRRAAAHAQPRQCCC